MSYLVLDSATPPTLAQAQQAKQEGYSAWLGYLRPSPGWSSAAWPAQAFRNVKEAGLATAGIHFGFDATGAIAQCRALGLDLCFTDKEADDSNNYAAKRDAIMAAGIRDGLYALRQSMESAHVRWYAAEHWSGQPNEGGQYGYRVQVAGVAVDVSEFDPAVFTGGVIVDQASATSFIQLAYATVGIKPYAYGQTGSVSQEEFDAAVQHCMTDNQSAVNDILVAHESAWVGGKVQPAPAPGTPGTVTVSGFNLTVTGP